MGARPGFGTSEAQGTGPGIRTRHFWRRAWDSNPRDRDGYLPSVPVALRLGLGAELAPRRGSSSSSSPQIVFSRGPADPERHSGACASPTKTSSLRGDHCQVTVGLARHHGQFGHPAAVSGMNQAQLQALVDEATVDAYDRDEQVMGLNTMIEDILAVPFETTVLGSL